MGFRSSKKRTVDLQDVLEADDPFREKKVGWANELCKRLSNYVELERAESLTRAVLLIAFETHRRVLKETVESNSSGLSAFLPIFLPGITTGGGGAGQVVRTEIEVGLRFCIPVLIQSEERIARELGLVSNDRWLYPFAVIKLLLIAKGERTESKVGPREAVVIWSATRLGKAETDVESALKHAMLRYGGGLPKV